MGLGPMARGAAGPGLALCPTPLPPAKDLSTPCPHTCATGVSSHTAGHRAGCGMSQSEKQWGWLGGRPGVPLPLLLCGAPRKIKPTGEPWDVLGLACRWLVRGVRAPGRAVLRQTPQDFQPSLGCFEASVTGALGTYPAPNQGWAAGPEDVKHCFCA